MGIGSYFLFGPIDQLNLINKSIDMWRFIIIRVNSTMVPRNIRSDHFMKISFHVTDDGIKHPVMEI